jgi:hypothetical protein
MKVSSKILVFLLKFTELQYTSTDSAVNHMKQNKYERDSDYVYMVKVQHRTPLYTNTLTLQLIKPQKRNFPCNFKGNPLVK